jgi:NAD/NADP transhydrogenase beta subunit
VAYRYSTAVQSLVQKQQVNEGLNCLDRRVTFRDSTAMLNLAQKQQVNETLSTIDRGDLQEYYSNT